MTRRTHAHAELRPCPSYPGYSASADGKVFTHWGARAHRSPTHPPRELKPDFRRGYAYVAVTVGPRRGAVRVHRMVLDAFVGPRGPEVQGRHLDGDKTNNAASNLAWGTALDNAADRLRHGGYRRGAANPNARMTEADVVWAREEYARGRRIVDIAAAIGGVTPRAVSLVVHRHVWRHL